ncbi:transcriptional regulator, MarR family [Methylophaga frappieri]|uniref:Transcriptional regulator, MarR family n=1 Tax=Methylophaga frappieri (strain ATCC BAA-2434 / DSM 25690 / JAM7) TaxID=754477 RepID=I1YFP6_METFJ|nr:MarR family transcriptional regulator [Methylophaga frappieri]AFJ01739.1 transcriptional regulator, MarR family [Methylophaga frappieri]
MHDDIDTIVSQWHALGLKTDFDAIQIAARILRLAKSLEQAVAALHLQHGLKQGEFDVLAALRRSPHPSLTPSALYQTMLLSSGAMTSRLDRLEKKRLIQRQHCQQDRRSIKVALTEKGKQCIDTIYPAHFALLSSLLNSLEKQEKTGLVKLLKSTSLSITQTDPEKTDAD